MKKRVMKLMLIVSTTSICWMIFAQSCMKFRTSDSLAEQQFTEHNAPFKGVYYKAGNRLIHYAESSHDSTLPLMVFIHGSPGSWNAFEQYMQDSALLRNYRMISIDRPGFGYSEFGNAQNLNDQAKALSSVLNYINNGQCICLVGHSLGGPMIIKLAADNPALPITNLVMIAGSVDPSEEKPESWRVTLDRTPLRYLVPGAMRPSNAELLMFKQDVFEMPEALAKVTCKVLLMHGDKDDFVPPGNVAYAQKYLTNAKEVKTVWFKGERHFIPWTKFTDIRDALLHLDVHG